MRELLETEPGTYGLTDFLVRTFRRTGHRRAGTGPLSLPGGFINVGDDGGPIAPGPGVAGASTRGDQLRLLLERDGTRLARQHQPHNK
jgi:hypothetical protein